jgi:hypothetical protein
MLLSWPITHSPAVLLPAGTRQLLDAAAKTFKQQSGALQSKVHSTYQRSIASSLTRMRVMHMLEDNTTGGTTAAGAQHQPCLGACGPQQAVGSAHGLSVCDSTAASLKQQSGTEHHKCIWSCGFLGAGRYVPRWTPGSSTLPHLP